MKKAGWIFLMVIIIATNAIHAQQPCTSFEYNRDQIQAGSSFKNNLAAIEQFTNNYITSLPAHRGNASVVTIPVVVHVLYHQASEKINDEQVAAQLEILNECFRKRNADTSAIPSAFKRLAADCEIEFKLATSDPKKRYTTGIVRKYSPVSAWANNDKTKLSIETGDDGWDSKSYLNIWVCKLDKFAGYATFPGGDPRLDGIVIDVASFAGHNKTIVHEAGHWLNLKHIWGDEYCGDDGVSDTPKQACYTPGCPTTVRVTCSNGPDGDMYMNYMDFTNDACTHLFTTGQKNRMQSLFAQGGARSGIVVSRGLDAPLIFESPLPEEDPKWLESRLYPNPATSEITIDLAYDERWIGNTFRVMNLQGQTVLNVTIQQKAQKINISRLAPGIYFLAAKRADGLSVMQKFIKL